MAVGPPVPPPILVFVYNADGGLFNLLSDVAHKLLSPRTYACNLCRITHSAFGMREEWRRFLHGLDMPLEFLHADEFARKYGSHDCALPAVFGRFGDRLDLWITAEQINRCGGMTDLKRIVADRVACARP